MKTKEKPKMVDIDMILTEIQNKFIGIGSLTLITGLSMKYLPLSRELKANISWGLIAGYYGLGIFYAYFIFLMYWNNWSKIKNS